MNRAPIVALMISRDAFSSERKKSENGDFII